MRKAIFFLIAAALCLGGCKENDEIFNTPIGDEMFSFKPVEGGAVLTYTLTDPLISKVKVDYTDEFGVKVQKLGDYSADTLLLDGFNTRQENVDVRVSFLDNNGVESQVKNYKFSTLPSNLYSFFDNNLKVESYWDGFQVSYNVSGNVSGSATVFMVGENPNTHAVDTLMLENIPLQSSPYTQVKQYSIDESQQQEEYTVVITTEDMSQRIARREVFKNIKGLQREILPNNNNGEPIFELLDPFNKSQEMPINESSSDYRPGALGKKYLFDGDTKGTTATKYYRRGYATPPFTFLTKENAIHTDNNDVYFVLDVKQEAMIGEMRFYYKYEDQYARNRDFGEWNTSYLYKLPCSIKVYAWTAQEPYDVNADQSTIPATNWKLMGTYSQDPNIQTSDRYYYNKDKQGIVTVGSLEQLNQLKALYASVSFNFDENMYRYYKIEFDATYNPLDRPDLYANVYNQVTCHEIEVYAKKN